MALSALTKLTKEQYQALNITPFSAPPVSQQSGPVDPNVRITLGGWVGENVMAFTITDGPETSSGMNIDSAAANTLAMTINSSPSPGEEIIYYTVNCGPDGKSSDWSLSFAETSRAGTGKWVFTKGKSDEVPSDSY